MGSVVKGLAITFFALLVCIPIMYFVTALPCYYQYNHKFGSHVVMAYDQATFEGISEQIDVILNNIYVEFEGMDFNRVYNTPFFWEQTYDNSLKAQVDYLNAIKSRTRNYIIQYNNLLNSSNSAMLEDWYHRSIMNLRTEMSRAGGLDWVIKNAWILEKYPFVYYMFNLGLIYLVLLIMMGLLLLLLLIENRE
ncbi:MAG: hypothetical protein ABC527_06910 [Candidatus Methanosuratincola petrocarbonis]